MKKRNPAPKRSRSMRLAEAPAGSTEVPTGAPQADTTLAPGLEDARQIHVVRHLMPIGSSGTEVYAGYYSEEYLHSLRGTQAADVWDKMRRSDAMVKACLSAVKNPLKSATWEFEAGDDTDEAKEDAEFANDLLLVKANKPWSLTLSEGLTMVDFGHSVFEEIHKVVLDDPKWGSHIGLASLGFRSQRTIERWNLDPTTEAIRSIAQWAQGDLRRTLDIPGEHLVVATVDREGANYEGVSMLRPCYGPWFRKQIKQKLDAIGLEKFAVPTPKLKVPANKFNTPEYQNALAALVAYTSHQSNYLTFPEGWDLTVDQSPYDPAKTQASIDAEDKQMAFAFLANFMLLGTGGNGGAFALGRDLSDFFLGGIICIADLWAETLSLGTVKRLILLNRGPRPVYPRLKVSGVDDKAGKEFAEMIKMLVDGRMLTPDDPLEVNLRKRMSLPPMSDEGKRPAPAAAPGGFGGGPGQGAGGAPAALSERTASRQLAESPRALMRGVTDEVRDLMQLELTGIAEDLVDQLVGQARKLPPAERLTAPKKVSPRGRLAFKKRLMDALAGAAAQGLEQVRQEVPSKRTLRLSEEPQGARFLDEFSKLPRPVQTRIELQADLLVDSQISDLEKALYFQFASSAGSTDSEDLLRGDLTATAAKHVEPATIAAGSNVVSLIVNEARNSFLFEPEVLEEIEAFEFVNADPVSPICADLAGTVFAKDDPEAKRFFPPLHHNCKSYLVPILKGSRRARTPDPTGLKPSSPTLERYITLSEAQRCGCGS